MANSKEYLSEGYKDTFVFHQNKDPVGRTALTYEVINGELIIEQEMYQPQSTSDNQIAIAKANRSLIRLAKKVESDFKKKQILEKRKSQIKLSEEKRREKEKKALERKKKLEAVLDAQRTSNYWAAKTYELTKEWEERKKKLNCENDLVLLNGFISSSGIKNVIAITKEEKKIYDYALKEMGIKLGKRKG